MAPVRITQLLADFAHSFVRVFQKLRRLLQQKGAAVIRQGLAGILFYYPVDIVAVIV